MIVPKRVVRRVIEIDATIIVCCYVVSRNSVFGRVREIDAIPVVFYVVASDGGVMVAPDIDAVLPITSISYGEFFNDNFVRAYIDNIASSFGINRLSCAGMRIF
jgi:hypothetical protein